MEILAIGCILHWILNDPTYCLRSVAFVAAAKGASGINCCHCRNCVGFILNYLDLLAYLLSMFAKWCYRIQANEWPLKCYLIFLVAISVWVEPIAEIYGATLAVIVYYSFRFNKSNVSSRDSPLRRGEGGGGRNKRWMKDENVVKRPLSLFKRPIQHTVK